MQFTYPWASIKDVLATGESFSIFVGHFALFDPDPATQINADPDPKPCFFPPKNCLSSMDAKNTCYKKIQE